MAGMGWKYRSHDELARAGFLFRSCTKCRWCGAAIALYRTPLGAGASGHGGGNTVAVDRKTFRPHKADCKLWPKKPEQRGLFDGNTGAEIPGR